MHKIQFEQQISLGDRDWVFDVRVAESTDVRFNGTVRTGKEAPVGFTLIRSATARWYISGDRIPEEVYRSAQMIGKIFQRQCA